MPLHPSGFHLHDTALPKTVRWQSGSSLPADARNCKSAYPSEDESLVLGPDAHIHNCRQSKPFHKRLLGNEQEPSLKSLQSPVHGDSS